MPCVQGLLTPVRWTDSVHITHSGSCYGWLVGWLVARNQLTISDADTVVQHQHIYVSPCVSPYVSPYVSLYIYVSPDMYVK